MSLSAAERIKLDIAARLINIPMPLAEGASFFDEAPPSVFMASVGSADNVKLGTDARSFFGIKGSKEPPAEVVFKTTGVSEQDAALIGKVPITIPASGNITLHFVSGYLPEAHPSA